ncbi:hypothetical protein NHX12_033547 [Muraenolepis orangiensis]|uniref:non-specific serine/threonine protein kinase n=1 Tax=Muraenolepis orangiensis TaxID=630683 RepID=A0A9Q0IJS3_9TELE|nr:hypothetical protein NHX12_033547 [Muraenolepis orangiensis]
MAERAKRPTAIYTSIVLRRKGYKLGKTIGEGEFGKTKIASSTIHGTNVAIKIMDRKALPTQYTVKFLPRELAILLAVNHEHIVRVHEVIEGPGGMVYIVMELMATDLLARLGKVGGRLSEKQAKTYFIQIVSAVRHLHQNDIVHRDLKCENILLAAGNKAKVSDFGFSRYLSPELSKTFCGSLAYISPEVFLGAPYDPRKSDIWSLGVMLYIMVTGRKPYDDSVVARLDTAHRDPVTYQKNTVPGESCRAFIASILQYEVSDRPDIQQVAESTWLQPGGGGNVAAAQ